MITFRELMNAMRDLEIPRQSPVIVHAGSSSYEQVNGGVDTLLGALLSSFDTVITPVFTYQTQLIPEVGPAGNGLIYGSAKASNANAQFFHLDLPADPSMGSVAEGMRRLPQARRSSHPILSFAGINAEPYLECQSLPDPLAPIKLLREQNGWAILIGVDHSANFSIHLAEQMAGRAHFLRWALTPYGVIECSHIPGCARGFSAIGPRLGGKIRQSRLETPMIQAVPLSDLIDTALAWLQADPLALLCEQPDCASCQAVRSQVIGV